MPVALYPPDGQAAALASLRGCLSAWRVLLWVSDLDPSRVGSLYDLPEASFPGYARQSPVWGNVQEAADGSATSTAAPLTWTRGSGGPTQTVYGWAALAGPTGPLVALGRFATPVTLALPGDQAGPLTLVAQLGCSCRARTQVATAGGGAGPRAAFAARGGKAGAVGAGGGPGARQGRRFAVQATRAGGGAGPSSRQGCPWRLYGMAGGGAAPAAAFGTGVAFVMQGGIGLGGLFVSQVPQGGVGFGGTLAYVYTAAAGAGSADCSAPRIERDRLAFVDNGTGTLWHEFAPFFSSPPADRPLSLMVYGANLTRGGVLGDPFVGERCNPADTLPYALTGEDGPPARSCFDLGAVPAVEFDAAAIADPPRSSLVFAFTSVACFNGPLMMHGGVGMGGRLIQWPKVGG